MIIVNILVFLISLSVVIVLHELGHFVMARRAGILCHEFSLGMGPIVWQTRKGETLYTIRAIPIGGFVMMAGEEVNDEIIQVGAKVRLEFESTIVSKIILDHESEKYEHLELITVESVDLKGPDMTPLSINEYEVKRDAFFVLKGRELQIAPFERGFNGKSKMQRFLAIFGGPAMNFILAFFVFLLVNLIVGFPNMDSTVIGEVGKDFPAYNEVKVGDQITEIEGQTVTNWDELSDILGSNQANRLIEFTVLRDSQEETVEITPILYFYSIGFHSMLNPENALIVGEVSTGSKADQAGIIEGDILLSIDGTTVTTWDDVFEVLVEIGEEANQDTRVVVFELDRKGVTVEVSVTEPFTSSFIASQDDELVVEDYINDFGFQLSTNPQDVLIIGDISEGTKANKAEMMAGDILLSIDGTTVNTWQDVADVLTAIGDEPYSEGRKVVMELDRLGSIVEVSILEPYSTAFLESQNIPLVDSRIGISPEYTFSLGGSFVGSFQNVGSSSMMIFTTIGLLFDSSGAGAGIGVDSLAGPLGIYEITSQALSQGAISLLAWIGLLSVNLGIINLLPIPALDGGRLVFIGYEALTKRKVNQKIENTLHYVMYIALLGLFVFITFNDLLRLLNIK